MNSDQEFTAIVSAVVWVSAFSFMFWQTWKQNRENKKLKKVTDRLIEAELNGYYVGATVSYTDAKGNVYTGMVESAAYWNSEYIFNIAGNRLVFDELPSTCITILQKPWRTLKQ